MIINDKHMEYDYDRHEYYLKYQGALDLTEYEDSELKSMFAKPELELKRMTQRVYQYVYSKNTAQNRKHIHFRIYHNLQGERQAILDATIEYLHGEMLLGKGHNKYKGGESDMPDSAVDILRNARLFNRGMLITETEYGDY